MEWIAYPETKTGANGTFNHTYLSVKFGFLFEIIWGEKMTSQWLKYSGMETACDLISDQLLKVSSSSKPKTTDWHANHVKLFLDHVLFLFYKHSS